MSRGRKRTVVTGTSDEWNDRPLSGDPGGDVAVTRTPEGQIAYVPVAIQRLAGGALEAYAELQGCIGQLHQLRGITTEVVRECRAEGVSWASIGFAAGITGEAARRRWSADVQDQVLDDRGQVSALGGYTPRNR